MGELFRGILTLTRSASAGERGQHSTLVRSSKHTGFADRLTAILALHEPARPTTPLPAFGHPLLSFGRRGEGRERSGRVQGFNARTFSGNSLPFGRGEG
jgi:hypothetical protein